VFFFKVCNFCHGPVVVVDRLGCQKKNLATPLLPSMLIQVPSLEGNIWRHWIRRQQTFPCSISLVSSQKSGILRPQTHPLFLRNVGSYRPEIMVSQNSIRLRVHFQVRAFRFT